MIGRAVGGGVRPRRRCGGSVNARMSAGRSRHCRQLAEQAVEHLEICAHGPVTHRVLGTPSLGMTGFFCGHPRRDTPHRHKSLILNRQGVRNESWKPAHTVDRVLNPRGFADSSLSGSLSSSSRSTSRPQCLTDPPSATISSQLSRGSMPYRSRPTCDANTAEVTTSFHYPRRDKPQDKRNTIPAWRFGMASLEGKCDLDTSRVPEDHGSLYARLGVSSPMIGGDTHV